MRYSKFARVTVGGWALNAVTRMSSTTGEAWAWRQHMLRMCVRGFQAWGCMMRAALNSRRRLRARASAGGE